jgi:hypothetical protein
MSRPMSPAAWDLWQLHAVDREAMTTRMLTELLRKRREPLLRES